MAPALADARKRSHQLLVPGCPCWGLFLLGGRTFGEFFSSNFPSEKAGVSQVYKPFTTCISEPEQLLAMQAPKP